MSKKLHLSLELLKTCDEQNENAYVQLEAIINIFAKDKYENTFGDEVCEISQGQNSLYSPLQASSQSRYARCSTSFPQLTKTYPLLFPDHDGFAEVARCWPNMYQPATTW